MRFYAANDLSFAQKAGVYLSRWGEFLTSEPREANTEGGVMPAIFGTAAMTLLMVIAVAPFGVITALYLREYAKQGRMVAFVRISVNNLAGVPSIVYGVFGLGFFAYVLGSSIDALFFPERLPNPTFGTGGLLWSALTLALLTVPVVIVATEEGAGRGASLYARRLARLRRLQMADHQIHHPAAGDARHHDGHHPRHGARRRRSGAVDAGGRGQIGPAAAHRRLSSRTSILERAASMHLGFHIYDVGFQSRNAEAGKPMVFVTTMLLMALIFVMNISAIVIRSRLKRKFQGSQF